MRIKMSFQVLTKSQMNEKNLIKPLNDFFKTKDGKPFCFGRLGEYQNENKCSDCKYKKECFKIYDEK